MGMSASVRLVVGVPYRIAIRTETVKREETRYDEKTGKPYQKEITESRLMLGNQPITHEDWEYLPLYKDSGLELFDPGYDELDEGGAIVGVSITRTGDLCDDATTMEIDPAKIEECRLKALRAFTALGIDEGRMGLFMVPSVG